MKAYFPLYCIILNLLFSAVITPTAKAKDTVVLDRLEASVNSIPILKSDLEKYIKNLGLRAQIDPLFANSSIAISRKAASNQEIIDAMINNRLIEKEFPKTDAEVEQEISTIQSNNHIDRNTLKEALQREGYSFSDYFDLIRESASKKDLIGREIQTKITVSEDDVKNYYLNHLPTRTRKQKAFHLQLISITAKNYKTPAAANQIAKSALAKIKKGESFDEVAKQVSDDSTASQGGDLGTLTEDQMSPAIRNEVKRIKVGGISDLFDGGNGRKYILKLVEVKTTEGDQYEKMKDEIRSQLMAKEYEQQVKLWVERKRQSAVIHISGVGTLAPIAPLK